MGKQRSKGLEAVYDEIISPFSQYVWQKTSPARNYLRGRGPQVVAAANIGYDTVTGNWPSAVYRYATFPKRGYVHRQWRRYGGYIHPSPAYFRRQRGYLAAYNYRRKRVPYWIWLKQRRKNNWKRWKKTKKRRGHWNAGRWYRNDYIY